MQLHNYLSRPRSWSKFLIGIGRLLKQLYNPLLRLRNPESAPDPTHPTTHGPRIIEYTNCL